MVAVGLVVAVALQTVVLKSPDDSPVVVVATFQNDATRHRRHRDSALALVQN
jgi:hypothetical protein